MKVYTLTNGIRVATEQLTYLRSISVGIWVGAGCFAENEKNNGISHFIEHMLFKGTKTRSAMEIANCIDALGGQINAFTAKECTCFYINILNEHYGIAIDLLCDMITNSKLDKTDIEKEKGVVCEEISMVEDAPDDLANEKLAEAFFGKHPLGKTILGTQETVRAITDTDMREYMAENYVPSNIVISVAGNFNEDEIVDMLEEKIGTKLSGNKQVSRCPGLDKPCGDIIFVPKTIEQINLCLGFPGVGQSDKRYFAQSMIANVLGGGMSSRLFQRVREQNGMTYAIYSYLCTNVNSGMLSIYAGMNPNQACDVLALIKDEMDKMRAKGMTEKEFIEAKEQLKGGFVLGLESAGARMTRNGRILLLNGKVLTVDQVIEGINNVTDAEINENIKYMFNNENLSASAVGKCKVNDDLYKALAAMK